MNEKVNGVFVDPGLFADGRKNRNAEYDAFDDAYAQTGLVRDPAAMPHFVVDTSRNGRRTWCSMTAVSSRPSLTLTRQRSSASSNATAGRSS